MGLFLLGCYRPSRSDSDACSILPRRLIFGVKSDAKNMAVAAGSCSNHEGHEGHERTRLASNPCPSCSSCPLWFFLRLDGPSPRTAGRRNCSQRAGKRQVCRRRKRRALRGFAQRRDRPARQRIQSQLDGQCGFQCPQRECQPPPAMHSRCSVGEPTRRTPRLRQRLLAHRESSYQRDSHNQNALFPLFPPVQVASACVAHVPHKLQCESERR